MIRESHLQPIAAYPAIDRGDHVDRYHGVDVPDPYHVFDNLQDESVRCWVSEQKALTDSFLARNADRAQYRRFLEERACDVKLGLPVACGERIIEFIRKAQDEQPAIYARSKSGGPLEPVVDPNRLDPQGRISVDVEHVFPSRDGKLLAYSLVESGADARSIRIRDRHSGTDLADVIPPTAEPTVAWHPDGGGFFYNVTRRLFAEPTNGDQLDGVYWHSLGAPIHEDRLVYEYHHGRGQSALPYVSPCGRYLFVKQVNYVMGRHGWLFRQLDEPDAKFTVLFEDCQAAANLIALRGTLAYFDTRLDAPNGRVVLIDLGRPERHNWRELVPESKYPLVRSSYSVLSTKSAVGPGHIVVAYERDAHHFLRVFDLDGRSLQSLDFPEFSTVTHLRHEDGNRFLIRTDSFSTPFTIYRLDAATFALDRIDAAAGTDPRIECEQVFFNSNDGTRIAMYMFTSPDLAKTSDAPTLLYGYGGWGQSITPEYTPEIGLWLGLGGRYVIANIRGGGEYGESWHDAGKLDKKQNVFDDFCAAARYLLDGGFCTRDSLAIKGLSNGGLLTAACLTQHPELFGAVISEIPLVDVVNLCKSEWGAAITAELGDASASKAMFDSLRAYSPLHNIDAALEYPPVLVVPAECDAPYIVSTAYKFIATLQEGGTGRVALLRLVHDSGHTGWTSRITREVIADEIAFLRLTLHGRGR